MPDSRGVFHGQGWSRKREEGWDRVFGTEMRAHDHDWHQFVRGGRYQPCPHTVIEFDLFRQRFCVHCGADVD
jgi:hypothetical protein